MGGGAVLSLGHEAQVGVVGGWSLNGQSRIRDVSHTPPRLRTPVRITDPGDPFAQLPEPTPIPTNPGYVGAGNMTIRSTSTVTFHKNNEPPALKIWPGIYCGGIRLGDSDGKTYVFQPGVYVLVGGGLTVTSNARQRQQDHVLQHDAERFHEQLGLSGHTELLGDEPLRPRRVAIHSADIKSVCEDVVFCQPDGDAERQQRRPNSGWSGHHFRRRAVFQTHAAEVCQQQHHQQIHRASGGSY